MNISSFRGFGFRVITFIVLAGWCVISGCSTRHVPDRRDGFGGSLIESVPIDEVPVHGYEVDVEMAHDSVSGELLAVGPSTIWVLFNEKVVPISRTEIVLVEVDCYASGALGLGIWTGVGALSTGSHGAFFIISLPVWLAVGIPLIVTAAESSELEVGRSNIDGLYQFARFPQGLPPGW